ncbi:MAG TPA: hypothetical protein VGN20_29050 [Mucilaginibacter sp.]|jgi:hypothetical protein
MIRKHLVLIGIVIAILLLVVAAFNYPGGSQKDPNSVGYDWKNNYLSNLFSAKAVNGQDNLSRPWASVGMLFLCASFGVFFINSSNKIASTSAARIIKYCGAGSMIFGFLAVTPLHDLMIPIVSTLSVISCFYITVFVLKSKLYFLKFLSIICLSIFYCCMYLYFTSSYLEFLPIVQKASFLVDIIWVLSLEYFTKKEDFQFLK